MHVLTIVGALFLQAAALSAGTEKAGDTYAITRDAQSSTQSDDGSSSTNDRDTITERVIGVTAEGIELEYNLPPDATAEDRARTWQFPARIFKPVNGATRLLNASELEARVDRWLKAGKLPRATCGHWIFTWNAFKIECDPQSVVTTIAGFDLRPTDLRDGATYRDPDSGDAAALRKTSGKGGATYTVTLTPDPDKVRIDRARSDVVIGEITRKPITLEAALHARSAERVTGSITISFDTDTAGAVVQRTKTTRLEIRQANGVVETSTATETLRRTRLAPDRPQASGDTI